MVVIRLPQENVVRERPAPIKIQTGPNHPHFSQLIISREAGPFGNS